MKSILNNIFFYLGYTPINKPTLDELKLEVASVAGGESNISLVRISEMLDRIGDSYFLTNKLKGACWIVDAEGLPKELSVYITRCSYVANVGYIRNTPAYIRFRQILDGLQSDGIILSDTITSRYEGTDEFDNYCDPETSVRIDVRTC